MAAGYPWMTEGTGTTADCVTENPDVSYWRQRALQAEADARHNRDLAEFTREMGLAVIASRDTPSPGD